MTLVRRRGPHLTIPGIAIVGALAVVVAAVVGQLAAAEVIGGALLIWAAVSLGWILTPRAANETDPGTVLKLDILLVLVVMLGLSGVTLIGLAIL